MGPDLGRAELRGSVTQLAGRMWNHWPAMSEGMSAMGLATPTFKGDDLGDVFAFLFVSRYTGKPGDPAQGRAAYKAKGCVDCHGDHGQGKIGPPLQAFKSESKEQVVQRMWNHAPRMRTVMETQRIPWPRLEPEELAGLLALMAEGWSYPSPKPH
jgi:mono/diheme cytochrome c family protein